MRFSAELLWTVLEDNLPPGTTGLLAALSGGRDSSCLLAVLAQARPLAGEGAAVRRALPLRAVHVDHGLQAASCAMRDAGAALCRRFDVPLEVVRVEVDIEGGVSVEAAARAARYRAFASVMKPGECLLTAHHALDQAETLLLQLLRGAGLQGLSAMPVCRPFAQGSHLRPLLGIAPGELHQLGQLLNLQAADDPMNRDPRFDRVYLRREVWPRIEGRWPAAAASLARAAQHLGDAQASLDASTRRATAMHCRSRACGLCPDVNVRTWCGTGSKRPRSSHPPPRAWMRLYARSSRRRPITSPPCNGASTFCAAIGTGCS